MSHFKVNLKDLLFILKDQLQYGSLCSFEKYNDLNEKTFDLMVNEAAKFAKGEREEADRAAEVLINMGIVPAVAEAVHAGTLKAWGRVEVQAGRALPEEFFKTHIIRLTKVTG